eukprot:6932517-Prymnesium_polylepis.1
MARSNTIGVLLEAVAARARPAARKPRCSAEREAHTTETICIHLPDAEATAVRLLFGLASLLCRTVLKAHPHMALLEAARRGHGRRVDEPSVCAGASPITHPHHLSFVSPSQLGHLRRRRVIRLVIADALA